MTLYRNRQRFVGGLRRFGIFALIAALFINLVPAANAAGPYTVVTPANPAGWQPLNVRADATVGITTAQPRGDTPNNLGSLQFTTNTVTNGQDKADYVNYWGVVAGRTLGNLSALSYEFYRASSSTTAQHFVPAFRLAYQTSDNKLGYLIWENVYNGGSTSTPVPTDQWLAKDILAGNFWMRNSSANTTVEQYDVTLAQWANGATFTGSQPLDANTSIIGIEIGVGSGWGGTFTGYVDDVAASFTSASGTDSVTANFEPTPQCTTDCYVDDDTGNDANGGTSFADAKQHIQAGIDQVSSGGTVHVKDGVYDQALTIGKPLTLEGIQHGVLAKGRPGPEATIRLTTNQTPITINASNVTVDGFTFDMSQEHTPWAITALNQPSYSNLTLHYNIFTGNPGTGDPNQDAGGAYLRTTTNTLIEGNFFDRLGSHAVFMAGSSDGTIYRNNDSLRNNLSNLSNQDGPHTNTLVENNRAVEDSAIIFASDKITIRNNSYTATAANSSRVYLGGGDTHVTVDGNTFTDMRAQAVQVFDATFGYGPNSDVTITNNRMPTNVANQTTGGPYSLIDLRGVGGINTVDSNTITLSGSLPIGITGVNGVSVRGSGTGAITISNNAVDGGGIIGTSVPSSTAVIIRSNTPSASGVGPTGVGALPAAATINIANNYLQNFRNGVAVYDFAANSYGGLPAGVGLTVNLNSITGNFNNGVITSASDPSLNAERNWWGSNTGPTAAGNPGGSGDKATGNVDYDPWLCSGTDTSAATGFQPNPQVSPCTPPPPQCTTDCYVDDDTGNDANGGTSFADAKQHIQAGVDQVSSGGTVHVKDGVYNEAITIGKPLTLEGIQHGVLAKGRPGPEAIIRLTTNQTPITINASNVTVNGFTFDMSQEHTPWAITALNLPSYSNLKVQDNIFTGNPGTGDPNQDAGGAYLRNTADLLIEGNFFDRLGDHAIFLAGTSTNAIYRNNDSYRNFNSNISTQDTGAGHSNTLIENNRAVEDDMILFNMHNATVRNNTITGGSFSTSRIWLGGGNSNVLITGNSFASLQSTAVQVFDAGFGYGPNSNITVTSNTINTTVANQVDNYSLVDFRDVNGINLIDSNKVTLSGNYAAGGSATYAVGVRGSGTGTVTITNNEFDGGNVSSSGTPPSSAVLIRSNSANGALTASAVIKVANNYLKNFSNGLTVYDFVANSYGGLPAGVSLTVNRNSITGNSANGVITSASDPTLNAENNWWGSNTGPTAAGNPGGTGDKATGNVDYEPWLCSGTDDQPATTGFQTSAASSPCIPPPPQCTTTCYVNGTTGSDSNGGASAGDAKKTIQAAVNQVSPNGTVIIAAGTYPEQVTISKDGLTIQGAGSGQTIIQGSSCTGNGITLVGTRNGLTVEDLSVTGFENGIYLGVISDTQINITIEDVNASANCRHGIISQDGVITNLSVNRVTASNNGFPNSGSTGSPGRGIWIINGIKTNISITNSTFSNNFITGIDFGDGNVTGLTVTGNTVEGNGDAGISVLGAKGPGANLIDSNIVRNNARFGIEVKASTGTGADSGAGSLVISRNFAERTVAATDPRDYAGIAVINRSGNPTFNDPQPSGAVVANNEVRGYHRAPSGSTGDGFGIVIEGLNNVVKNNIVTNNDVGIQVQGGNTANTQSTNFFDRGNATLGDAIVSLNSIAGNGIGLRTVRLPSDTPTLNAERNWWGSNTGPTNVGNPGGSGDSVVGNVDYDPWLCSGQDTSSATGFQPNPQTSPCTPPTGTLTVTKYNDLNRNHMRDSGEPGLSGWKITVKLGMTTVTSGTTDGNGNVTFTGLTPGSYTVCETQQSGWQNTDPSDGSGCKPATVTAGNTTNVVLGNTQQSLTVIKYNDLNRNGMQDSGEPSLSGWKITVKRGSNVVASGTTGSNGSITFTGLAAGSYTVCETQQSGWQNTDPSNGSGCKTVTLTATGATTVLLGNAQQRGSITVTKYNDLNHNGTKDKNEPTLSGWVITVLQGTTVVATGTTGSNGTATFNNLPLGNYTVCETQQSGWQNTDPSNGSGCKPVTVTVNCSLNVLFGNASIVVATGTLKVTKYNDVNRNGKRDTGEAGLSGWSITVSQGATTSASGVTNANGDVSFTLAPGSYKVCETKQPNWQNTDPSDGSGCKTVTVAKNSTATLVLGNAPAPSNPAPAQHGKIYAINDCGAANSQLFTVNLNSPNTVAALGPIYQGYDLQGLDISPTTGTIYVTSGSGNTHNQRGWLFKVDGVTGALTPIGSTGQTEVDALAFAPNGELWGWSIGKGLIKINLTTGASTLIFSDSKAVEGLAFSNDGSKVYASAGKKLYVYTLATNKIAELASNLPGTTEALEMRPDGKLLLGVTGSKVIYVYDPTNKQVTTEKISVAPYSDVEGIGYSAS